MTSKTSGLIQSFVTILLFIALLSSCSKDDGSRILGLWRAERLQVQSISLPMGPEFLVKPNELMSADGEIRIPISSIHSEGNVVTLDVPLGIGLSFNFENSNRISFDVPLVGRVYYRRVTDAVKPDRENFALAPANQVTAPSTRTNAVPAPNPPRPLVTDLSKQTTSTVFVSANQAKNEIPIQVTGDLIRQAEHKILSDDLSAAMALLTVARKEYGDDPLIDYNLALIQMRLGNQDNAVRNLRDAFQNGFRDFARLTASPEFAPIKNDPRYGALITRYR